MSRLLLIMVFFVIVCIPAFASESEPYRVGQTIRYANPSQWIDVPGTEQPNHGPLKISVGKIKGIWASFQEQDYTTIRRWRVNCDTGGLALLYTHEYHNDGHDGAEVHKIQDIGDGAIIPFDAGNAPVVFIRKTVCTGGQ